MRLRLFAVAAVLLTVVASSCRKHGTPVSQAYRFPFEQVLRGDDMPGEASEYEAARRTVDGEEIPVERYEQAWRHRGRMSEMSVSRGRFAKTSLSQAKELSLGAWEQLGPGNLAGISRSLVIDPVEPDTMYTTGVSGGIWKTTDAGANWRAVGDLLPILVIGSLAIDRNDPRVLYAGTGDGFLHVNSVRGAGIYKTADAGETWTRLASTQTGNFQYVNKLVVSPTRGNRVYAATNAGVMRSEDGGNTWTKSLDRGLPTRGCHDLAIRTDSASDYLFASCGNPGTRNGADSRLRTDSKEDPNVPAVVLLNKFAGTAGSWEEVLAFPNMGRTSLAIAPSNQAVVYAVASNYTRNLGAYHNALLAVYRSNAGGEQGTWLPRVQNTDPKRLNTLILSNPYYGTCFGNSDTLGQAWHDNAAAVDPVDFNRLWVGGVDLFRSDDGGQNFGLASLWWINPARTEYVHADQHAMVFHPRYDGAANRTMYVVTDGGVFRTDNARAATATSEVAPCDLERIGMNWRNVVGGLSTLQFAHGTVYPGGTAYVGGAQDNGGVRGSDASGARAWTAITSGDGGRSVIDTVDPNILYIAAQQFSLDKSIDGGSSFRVSIRGITEPAGNFAFVAPFAVDPKDSRRLWTAGNRIWTSANSADDWTAVSGPLVVGSFTAIAVSPHDSNFVVAGSRAGKVSRNLKATTAGSASIWDSAELRVGWISSIVFDPVNPQGLYATVGSFNRAPGDAHVYKSVDAGASWTALDGEGENALPDAPFHTISVNPDDPSMLVVGGDLGLFVSMDGGLNWAREDETFPAVVVNHLTFHKDAGSLWLYAFTFGRGAWRVRLSGNPKACEFTISPSSVAVFPAAGGIDTRSVEASAGDCPWTAISNANWIKVVTTAAGTGNGAVRILVDPNVLNPPRTGTVQIAGRLISIQQEEMIVVGQFDEWLDAPVRPLPYTDGIENITATSDINDPIHSCVGVIGSKTIWFRFSPAFSGTASVQGTGFRLDQFGNPGFSMAVYEDGGSRLGAELGCGFNASASPGFVSLGVPVTAGRTYIINLAGLGPVNRGGFMMVAVTRGDATVDFAPKQIDFGDVEPGQTVERRLLIRNAGNVRATLPVLTPGDAQFAVMPAANVSIDVRAARDLIVRFTASRNPGTYTATIPLGGGVEVPLTARVPELRPQAQVEPGLVDAGAVAAGESVTREIVVSNAGKGALRVESVEVVEGGAVFAVAADGIPLTLATGETRALSITFTPAEAGPQAGVIAIRTNDPAQPVIRVRLTGEGQ